MRSTVSSSRIGENLIRRLRWKFAPTRMWYLPECGVVFTSMAMSDRSLCSSNTLHLSFNSAGLGATCKGVLFMSNQLLGISAIYNTSVYVPAPMYILHFHKGSQLWSLWQLVYMDSVCFRGFKYARFLFHFIHKLLSRETASSQTPLGRRFASMVFHKHSCTHQAFHSRNVLSIFFALTPLCTCGW